MLTQTRIRRTGFLALAVTFSAGIHAALVPEHLNEMPPLGYRSLGIGSSDCSRLGETLRSGGVCSGSREVVASNLLSWKGADDVGAGEQVRGRLC